MSLEKSRFRSVSICVTDLLAEAKAENTAFSRSKKNGKVYVNLFVGDKEDADQYGQNVYIKLNPPKEDQEKFGKFIGNGKIIEYKPNNTPITSEVAESLGDDSDLPF